ncbi:Hypothetical predicted protein [Lecanosticta acicola]|uniref:Uncharacterized protein n=1 Tax=Lecanosticta acicola TaxID=111012 RepID=A0AAI8Z6A8_9PEZI|nr:Hypothetical predicted protein [Lecanosticta acicola]
MRTLYIRPPQHGTYRARPAKTPKELEMQRQTRKRLAEENRSVDLDSPDWKNNPFAVRLAPEVRIDSVTKLIPPNGYRAPEGRTVVPTPREFSKPGRELRKLRMADAWKQGTMDDKAAEMGQWFPDFPGTHDVFVSDAKTKPAKGSSSNPIDFTSPSPAGPAQRGECPSSDIGLFSKLPGEIRNRIYRMAVLEEDPYEPVKFAMEPGTCSTGACRHSKVGYNVPGIANTCRQMRWEVMPIFCVENCAFQFDDLMVHQSCVSNFLRSIGDYADIVPEYQFMLKRPLWHQDEFKGWIPYTFILTTPLGDQRPELGEDLFILNYTEPLRRMICACVLDKVCDEMNDGFDKKKRTPAIGKMVLDFLEGDEFVDFVWRMRKSKQWMHALKKCKACTFVKFNN